MRTLSPDTSPEAEAVLIKLLRDAPVWRRLQMADQMHETLRQLAIADIQRHHPSGNDEEIKRRLARRLLSRTEVISAYGWDPELEGY